MDIKNNMMLLIASLLLPLISPGLISPALISSAQAESVKPSLIFGYNLNNIASVSKQDVEIGFNSGAARYSAKYNLSMKLKVFDSKEALLTAFDQGEINGIFGLPTLVLERKNQLKDKMSAVVYANGQYKFRYLLIVRKADNISNIEQLKNRRISLPKSHEIESLYLNTLLLRHKQAESDQFFSLVANVANSNVAISDLFFSRTDAAVVNENEYQTAAELNPQIAQQTMILEQSDPLPETILAVRKGAVSDDFFDNVLKTSLEYQQTEEGRNAFKLSGMKSLVGVKPEELETTRQLKDEYEQLKKANLGRNQKSALIIRQKPDQKSNTASTKAERN